MNLRYFLLCSSLAIILSSCNQGSSKTAIGQGNGSGKDYSAQPVTPPLKELKLDQITRECSASEAQAYKSMDQVIQNSNSNIDDVAGKKNTEAIDSAVTAIHACDQAMNQVSLAGACKVTKTTIIGTSVIAYDAYRIDQKCRKTDSYLAKNNARPESIPNQNSAGQSTSAGQNSGNDQSTHSGAGPVDVTPVTTVNPRQTPINPVSPQPAPVVVNPTTGGTFRQCTPDEFSNLSGMSSSLDLATKQITLMGDSSNWKYDSEAMSNSAIATKACENLISYYDQNPCEKSFVQKDGSKVLRQYTGANLRQRCEKARTYFYEYVQNKSTLIFPNANLYLNISGFSTKTFETDYVNEIEGCRVENTSGHSIDYSGKDLVLIKDTRGFDSKMMVLESAEGLLVSCYGLNIDGPFSKRELVKSLKSEGTNMPLVYKLK